MRGRFRSAVGVALAAWLLLIVVLTQAPFRYYFRWRRLRRLPSLFDFGFGPGWFEPIANFLLFVPFGVLLGLVVIGQTGDNGDASRSPHLGRLTPRRLIYFVTLAGAALSLTVELLQAFQLSRDPSIVDLFLNTTGSFAGSMVVAVFATRAR